MVLKEYTQVYWIGIAIFLIVAYLRYIEKHSLFYPEKEVKFFPSDAGLSFKDVYFKSRDGHKLNGWFIPRENAKYTVFFAHGNAGNISHRLEKL